MRSRAAAFVVGLVLVVGGLVGSVAVPAAAQAPAGRGRGAFILQPAPTDKSVPIPKEQLEKYLKDMEAKGMPTLRMLEGGKYNVNIRRIKSPNAEIHPKTIDTWVVIEGGGTLVTGGKIVDGKIVGGQSFPMKVGDVHFIPANLPHGFSTVNGVVAWLNIRWDVDWPAAAQQSQ